MTGPSSMARHLIYSLVDDLAHKAAAAGIVKYTHVIEAGGEDDERLHNLLNTVERDAVHRAAMALRNKAHSYEQVAAAMPALSPHAMQMADTLRTEADALDPYVKIPTPVGAAAGIGCTEFCNRVTREHWHLKKEDS